MKSTPALSLSRPLMVLLIAVLVIAILAVSIGLLGLVHLPLDLASTGLPAQALAPAQATPTLTPIPSRTPFRALTYTPTVTLTPTPTATATYTPTSTSTATQPPPPPPPPLPDEAATALLVGHAQSLGLSCESRSAVDWANFFGVSISELEFLGGLPRSDNPEVGFVGDPSGVAGQVPPGPYGVHAAPVGRLLRAYSLPADDKRGLSWDELRAEIAQGQPVMVWVVGNVQRGYAVDYTAADGQTMKVAPFEHTVIVVGYTASTVSVVNNNLYYNVPLDLFLDSWGTLGNQAVINYR